MSLERLLELLERLLTFLANDLVYQCRWSAQLRLDVSPEYRLRLRHVRRANTVALVPLSLVNGLAFGCRPVFWGFVSKNPVQHRIAEVPDPRLRLLTKAL